ncbi:uncharacterized protein LOC131220963 [Magnolia sinica]|uniref:uncharacterized protein LOC131220963 n=1 Tax=Magnolia sinica TaxID=86752 RepID=UPI0026583C70|nr:uncharacterized protein LOC131220963 [Magnolia sinica]
MSSSKEEGEGGEEDLRGSQLEDVAWLSSLSDSELDVLISLKKLAIQRAKNIGYENLGNKLDLKMLRALGFILLEYLKEDVKNASVFSSPDKASTFLEGCRLLTSNREGGFGSMDIDDIRASIRVKRKRDEER